MYLVMFAMTQYLRIQLHEHHYLCIIPGETDTDTIEHVFGSCCAMQPVRDWSSVCEIVDGRCMPRPERLEADGP